MDIIYDHGLTNKRFGANLIFYKNILCNHCLHDLHLYIWKMLTNREMVYFQKWDFFIFLSAFTINCVTTGTPKMPIK